MKRLLQGTILFALAFVTGGLSAQTVTLTLMPQAGNETCGAYGTVTCMVRTSGGGTIYVEYNGVGMNRHSIQFMQSGATKLMATDSNMTATLATSGTPYTNGSTVQLNITFTAKDSLGKSHAGTGAINMVYSKRDGVAFLVETSGSVTVAP